MLQSIDYMGIFVYFLTVVAGVKCDIDMKEENIVDHIT